jgi:serine/threonine protein kinase
MAESTNVSATSPPGNIPGLTDETCLGYRLGKKLGSGGFAFVREAYDRDWNKVAIKFIKMDTGDRKLAKQDNAIVAVNHDGKALETIPSRLKRSLKEITTELMALQMITSPNVVKLYKYKLNHPYKMSDGSTWNSLAMVLECCEHGELFDLVYHGEALDEKVCRTFFRQIVNGLEALHSKNIAHRDIKPQNILMTKDFQCKIADIGSGSRFRESRLMKTTRVGTRGFQAPELLCGKNYSKKCDTFSLGVTLFVLMSKTMPCREEANVQDPLYVYMAATKYEDYWHKFRRGGIEFSQDLMTLLQGMLAYQPVERMNINDTEKDGVTLPGIKSSAWYNGEVYTREELPSVLRDRHLVARNQRNRVRNPETEINSVSFRSGTPTVLPELPPRREFGAVPLDPKATIMTPDGNTIQLHPDHVIQQLITHFEVETKRCTKTVWNHLEGKLQLIGETKEDHRPAHHHRARHRPAHPLKWQVNIDAYQRENEYFLDILPATNWHVDECKEFTVDLQKYLQILN